MEDASEATALAVVSIHTPARGVTVQHVLQKPLISSFNPHSRTGSDCFCRLMVSWPRSFQSTLPHGE